MDNKVAVVGTGYVGLTTGACFAHLGPPGHLCRHRRQQGRAAAPGRDPDLRAGPRGAGRRGHRLRSPHVHRRPGRRRQRGRLRLPVRAHPAGRGRLGRPQLPRGRGPPDRPAPAARDHRGQQVHRAGRLGQLRRAGHRPRRHPGGLQPRVPPRGHRGPRLPQPRPRRHRRRRPERGDPHRRPLPRPARAADGHRPGLGRDHQVRLERLPRHEALVRQRHRQPVRGRRRRRERRRARHGLRQAHRPRLPPARAGLGRQLLPEGLPRPALHGVGGRATSSASSTPSSRSTRSSSAGWPTRSSAWSAATSRA